MAMEEEFYDSLDEETFCECQSQPDNENLKSDESQKFTGDPENIVNIIPLYKREIPKDAACALKKRSRELSEGRKIMNKGPLPVRDKKQNRTYLNLFYTKIKYPATGGGDVLRWKSGSDTTRANYDPSSRKSSAVAGGKVEEFFTDNECSTDEESFYEKFIAEEELKSRNAARTNSDLRSTSGTISNFLSVSEQFLTKTEIGKKNTRKRPFVKASSVSSQSKASGLDEYNTKLQLLRKRQYYGQKASSRNRVIMEEARIMRSFKTKLQIQ